MQIIRVQLYEEIKIGEAVKMKTVLIHEDAVRIGFTAPMHIEIDREEVRRRKRMNKS